jgi:uncharacterized membrane protein YqaE (UPF0057 family)
MDTIDLTDIDKISTPVLLALFLNIVGVFLKQSFINNKWIPLALLMLGGIVNVFLGLAPIGINHPKIYLLVQGVCIGGLAIGLNQAFRQLTKDKNDTSV